MSRRGDTLVAAVLLACRLVAGGVFLYAALGKIGDPAGFAQAIFNYRLVPAAALHPLALLLPWVEAVTGAALIVGLARRGAALLASAMTVMFLFAIGAALARGLDISCGCFDTSGGHAVGLDLLARDCLLLAACLLPLVLAGRDRWRVASWRRAPRGS